MIDHALAAPVTMPAISATRHAAEAAHIITNPTRVKIIWHLAHNGPYTISGLTLALDKRHHTVLVDVMMLAD